MAAGTVPCLCLAPCRDLLQTLTEEELHALERSLCVSQDMEFPIRAEAQLPPALAPAFAPPLPPEELLPAKAEVPGAELACSLQYDQQELEQLSRMVHRAGAEMSSLLSPPSAGQSPARGPHAEGSPGGRASPGSGRPQPGSDEEEGRVFFMDDVEAAAEAPGGDPSHNNNNVQDGQMPPAGPGSCSCLDGWEGAVEAAEVAEVIAQRTGGMKLSATVIFNPKPPTAPDPAAPEAPASGVSPSEPAAEGPEGGPHELGSVAANGLLNSCVCCGGCGGGREDTAESLPGRGHPGGIIRACHMGAAKASAQGGPARPEEARPALQLPAGAPAPPRSEGGPAAQEPEDPTSSKCLNTSGPPVDWADRPQEPEGGRQDGGQHPEAGEDSRRPAGPR